ncbi:SIMPL domain-containing protein [Moraxella marmotae]|uniref:SIMPL domain-containing protein n=1 Tax=Moraxella marmotae TaxID=3344520 RepID=UPI0035F28D48
MKSPIFLTGVLMTALAALPAHADEYNRISFSSEVKSEIANDEMRATMSKTAQAATAAAIAKELNSSINAAMQIAKRYPEVSVSTGRQSTYPRYANGSNKIVGFTGSVSVEIKSNNFEKASQLIADLQSIMVMENIGFSVSEQLRESEEKRLQLEAIKRFGDEAATISQAFGSSSYKIVNVSLGGNHNHYYRPMAAMSMKVADASSAIESQSLEAGNTTLTYTANGTIELVK